MSMKPSTPQTIYRDLDLDRDPPRTDREMSADIESREDGRQHTLLLSNDRKAAQLWLPLAQKAQDDTVGGDNRISRIRLILFKKVPD
jgi:hypothetical protein